MPEPVYLEHFLTRNVQSCLLTKHLCFGQSIRTHSAPFNAPQQPFESCPEEERLSPCEIFHHQLPPGASSLLNPANVPAGSGMSCSAFVQVMRSKVSCAYGRFAVSPVPICARSTCTCSCPFRAMRACTSMSALASTPYASTPGTRVSNCRSKMPVPQATSRTRGQRPNRSGTNTVQQHQSSPLSPQVSSQ